MSTYIIDSFNRTRFEGPIDDVIKLLQDIKDRHPETDLHLFIELEYYRYNSPPEITVDIIGGGENE